MAARWALLLATAAAHLTVLAAGPRASVDYTNHFAVVVQGGRPRAERAAAQHHCSVIDSIGDLTDHYLLKCHTVKERSPEHSEHHVNRLRGSDSIMWADQQYYKKRKKRDGAGYFPLISELSDPFRFGSPSHVFHRQPAGLRPAQTFWPDPLFSEQWYLNGGAHDGSDMNVIPAWRKGYSGKGVVVSILDDGIQPNHPDLSVNYDSQASLDINDNDDDPTPRDDGSNRHGTRCAGEVAALAGNSVCGVGVAPNASIGGVRMLDGGVNDYVEAKALSFRRSHIDVYSASWGPEDDGMTVDGPGPLARRAFIEGVLKGRGGKGSIFVWASGNGGQYMDNCNCDGYTNSIFTLSISSASQAGKKPWYLEECASTLATTYSSGSAAKDKSIVTCDQDAALRPKYICTKSHTGTSASAPLAAGMCALALEANPMLTWRDMQYIVLMTSRYQPLASEGGWFTNAVGRKVNHKFGYGMMDGAAMVDLAGRWTSVPAQHICISPIDSRTRSIPTGDGAQLHVSMQVTGCQSPSQTVNFLEHVQCKVTLTYAPRGNLRIMLTAPSGTASTLLFGRPRDETGSSFDRWPFMTVHFWGEKPHGVWNLTIIPVDPRSTKSEGVLKEWQLILYGTEQQPVRARPEPEAQFGASSTARSPLVGRSQTSVAPEVFCSLQCVRSCRTKPVGPGCDHCRELHKSDCSRSCEPGTFASLGAGCKACHSSCGACFGNQQNQCLKCPPHHYLISELSVCVVACPDGYFTVNETCMSCGAQCASCTGSASHCLSCPAHLILYKDQCVASCPAGTYERGHRCEPCAASCQTCVGPSDANCVLCRYGLMRADGQCVAACPEGWYGDVTRGECVACLPGCAVCSSLGSCDACYDQLQLSADTGVCESADQRRCADGEFYGGGLCQRCHRSCRGCSGPSSVDCTQCQPDRVLHNGLCRRDCPEGLSSVGGLCTACPHACLDCYTVQHRAVQRCSSCQQGLLLHNETCVAACPDRTYRSLEECVPCAPACSTCFGGEPDECASCPSGGLLVSGSCHAACPVGYYRSWSGCRRCHRTCHTCTGSALTTCRSCYDDYQLLTEYGTCMPCGSHEFFAPDARVCRRCHSTCGTCEGAGSTNCTSCAGELRLEVPSHRCVPCCGQLQNTSGDVHQPTHCCQCHPANGQCARGTRRRTADGYHMEPAPPPGAPSWLYLQAAALCAGSVVCFTLIFTALQCRQRTRRHYHPVLELSDGEEHLALTDYQDKDHMDDWSDDDHLVVFDART